MYMVYLHQNSINTLVLLGKSLIQAPQTRYAQVEKSSTHSLFHF